MNTLSFHLQPELALNSTGGECIAFDNVSGEEYLSGAFTKVSLETCV